MSSQRFPLAISPIQYVEASPQTSGLNQYDIYSPELPKA